MLPANPDRVDEPRTSPGSSPLCPAISGTSLGEGHPRISADNWQHMEIPQDSNEVKKVMVNANPLLDGKDQVKGLPHHL